ncbi:MAG: isoprenylcysteine carboxylmethyltransferase family protein [Phycisphaerales bacterium]|nr:isoprenylcysteine carboxylmethyltransferase family protein [Phycisphaerales bacterium]
MNGRLDGGAPRAFALSYLAIESLGVAGYWAALALMPQSRASFTLTGAPPSSLWSLSAAEASLLASGVLALWGLYRRKRWARPLLWLHAGAAIYAALLAAGMAVAEPRLWPGAGLMLPVLVVPLSLAVAAERADGSAEAPRWLCVAHTLVQTVFFWAFFLLIVPVLLRRVEVWLGLSAAALSGPGVRAAGIAIFAAASCIGLSSGWSMATAGRGTPLPTSPARRLVVTGPYRWVRNPMALAGVLQAVAAGLWLGSWVVIAYALCGAVLWHVAVRPQEERELSERFGEEFAAYRRVVRCWVPRLSPLLAR